MRLRVIIRILTVVIVLLPLSELFLVSYDTFVDYSNEWREVKIKKGSHSYYPSIHFVGDLKEIDFILKPMIPSIMKNRSGMDWSKIRGFQRGCTTIMLRPAWFINVWMIHCF
ncbi:MAG: hypothetical protein R2764_17860 [Bacteroidales bacterium]